jgi:5-methylthioadenosine/S-adenosylhomocysteine deaminase
VAEIKEEIEFCKKVHGHTTVKHLNNLGFLGSNVLAIHSVWLDDEELHMFKDSKVNVSHCPAAAMRYLGFARVPEMVDMGINVSIGTDGYVMCKLIANV